VRYSAQDIATMAGARPFRDISEQRLLILHRHWLWADHARRWLLTSMEARVDATGFTNPGETRDMAGEDDAAMLVWYGLLHALIEAVTADRVVTADPLRSDLRVIREPLRESRHSVFHVPDAYWDDGYVPLLVPQTVNPLHRAHGGLGTLLREEMRVRREPSAA
jgi:hypothetical protein